MYFKVKGFDKGKVMDYVMFCVVEFMLLEGYDWFVVIDWEILVDKEIV